MNQPKQTAGAEIKLVINDERAGVIEAVRDPLAVTTTEGKIVCVNAAMEIATGFARAEMTGTDLAGYFASPPDARAAQHRAFGCGFIPEFPLELLHRDGHRTPVLCNFAVQRDAAGKPTGLIVVGRNLSAVKRAEEELLRVNEEMEQKVAERTARLEAANKELEAFSYSVAHDLRAPLRSINAYSQRLTVAHSEQLDAAGRTSLESLMRAARRMSELIDDLLELSSINGHDLNRTPVDLSLLAQTVLGDLQKAEPEREVRLIIAPGLTAHADARLMKIVFENLLSNAWKFVAAQTSAEIEVGVIEGKGVRAFFVRDNGVGFAMEYAQRLFGAFQRFHSPGEFPGMGIGLATVQRIIHRHGGRVWAESRISQGAAFYFTLPEAAV